MNGIININKEKGYTSQQVVSFVKKILNVKKAGHTGTLDPNATGVLPICLGRATKFAGLITGRDKIYKAVLILGIKTDTQDITGNIIEKKHVNIPQLKIKEAIYSFVGEIEQMPPMYSAIKVNGVRLHTLARQNIEIERKKRRVKIHNIKVVKFISLNEIEIEVHCTGGTYIRTLCEDIGAKLNVGGVMGDLVRLASGSFFIDDSFTLGQLKCFNKDFIVSIENILVDYPTVFAMPCANKYLQNGNKLISSHIYDLLNLENNQVVKVYGENKKLYGLYKLCENELKPVVYIG